MIAAVWLSCAGPSNPEPAVVPPAMVRVPAGTTTLAPPMATEPAPPVAIDPFEIGVSHVTAAQFAAFAPERVGDVAWRSHTEDARCNVGSDRADHPANCVNWYAARAWCASQGMRLPTEAEWEHAARAGTTTAYWWGEAFDPTRAVACATQGCEATEPVALEGPRCNAWGVCDVSGNVWEWTRTTWGAPPHDLSDPLASKPTTGLMRGGSMVASADDPVLQVGYRSDLNLQNPNFYMGFRCVR